MKRFLVLLIALSLILMAASCSQADEPEELEEVVEDIEPSVEGEELVGYELHGASFKVPASWELIESDSEDAIKFYHSTGVFKIQYLLKDPGLDNPFFMEATFDAISDVYQGFEFISQLRYLLDGNYAYNYVFMADFSSGRSKVINDYFYHDRGVLEVSNTTLPDDELNLKLAEDVVSSIELRERRDEMFLLEDQFAAAIGGAKADYDLDDGIIRLTTKKFEASYLKHEVSEDFQGNPVLLYYYSIENLSQEEIFASSFSLKAFQNDTELDSSLLLTSIVPELENRYSSIGAGATIEVCSAFLLEDESQVLIEGEPIFESQYRDIQVIELP